MIYLKKIILYFLMFPLLIESCRFFFDDNLNGSKTHLDNLDQQRASVNGGREKDLFTSIHKQLLGVLKNIWVQWRCHPNRGPFRFWEPFSFDQSGGFQGRSASEVAKVQCQSDFQESLQAGGLLGFYMFLSLRAVRPSGCFDFLFWYPIAIWLTGSLQASQQPKLVSFP